MRLRRVLTSLLFVFIPVQKQIVGVGKLGCLLTLYTKFVNKLFTRTLS